MQKRGPGRGREEGETVEEGDRMHKIHADLTRNMADTGLDAQHI